MSEDQKLQRVDVTTPNPARIYDYMLGGKDNFAPDRAVGDKMVEVFPRAKEGLRLNRQFMIRAVRHLATEAGIRQFLDIGTGLPTNDNVHQVAQKHAPDSRVVYVDNDPIVVTHARALLTAAPDKPGEVVAVQGDLREPTRLLADPAVLRTLDFNEPIALLLVAILHFIPDSDKPYELVRELVQALPSGSYLVLSHSTDDVEPDAAHVVQDAYRSATAQLTFRDHDQVAAFFEGLELLEPGVVWTRDWRPEGAVGTLDGGMYAGVARKP